MSSPKQLLQKLQKLDLVDCFDQAMQTSTVKNAILSANREQLRFEGKLATGKKIRPLYAKSTRKKKTKSYTSPTPDLYETGKFQRKIEVKRTKKGEHSVKSSVSYAPYLEKKYTKEIYGVAPKNESKVKKELVSTTFKYIRLNLGL